MRYKKIVSGLLACAMVVTSAFAGNVVSAKAADEPVPVEVYNFENGLGEGVAPVVNGQDGSVPPAYEGETVFEDGRPAKEGAEAGKAVKLGDYGLLLPEDNIGSNYTVSMWVKLQGDMGRFMPIMFLGSASKWIGIAGAYNPNSVNCILWGQDAGIASADEPNFSLEKDAWVMLTVTQEGGNLNIYKNGEHLKALSNIQEVLSGEGQKVHVGVNPWEADGRFPGLVDDISIYNTALSAAQVHQLYDGRTAEEVFKEEGFTVPQSLSVFLNGTTKLSPGLSDIVKDAAEITYQSANSAVATVGADGTVTGVGVGTTTITTTVKVGNTTAEPQTTTVEVKSSEGVDTKVAVEYSLAGASNGKLVDISGHGNDAVFHGTEGTDYEFVQENGNNVLQLKSDAAYLDLPKTIMDSLDDKEAFTIETTFAKSSACGNNAWLFCFGSDRKSSGTNYLFLSPNFEGSALRAGIKNTNTEKLFATAIRPVVNNFYTVNMVFDHGTIKLYWNGVLIQGTNGDKLESGYSIMDDVVTPGNTNDASLLGYIGNSCWSADKRFQGKIASFKIYNKAMSDAEVQLSRPEYQEALQESVNQGLKMDDIMGSNNASADEIRYNMPLPSTFNEMNVTWASEPNIISETGVVKNGAQDQKVVLTATVTSGALKATKSFEVTVKALDRGDLDAVLAEAKELYQDTHATQQSRENLQKAIALAEAVEGQSQVEQAISALRKAINRLEFSESYKDPFSVIDESALTATRTVTLNKGVRIFTVPDAIKDSVTVSYKSSNDSIASVSNGVVTGKKLGNVKITTTVKAAYDGFEMEYQTIVKVDLDMKGAKAKAKATTLAKGKNTTIAVSVSSAIKSAKYTTSYKATGAVSVNKSGKVTAKKAGTGKVYVTIKSSGKSITRTVTIKVGEITGSSSVKVKKSINLKVKGISGKVKWSLDSKGKKLATISSSGKLKAKKKAGKVTVTAKVGSVTMKKTIVIKK